MEAMLEKEKVKGYLAYKDSGVEWLGEIPVHWEVKRLKYILEEINERSITGEEELLSLSKYKGIVPKSSLEERAGQANSLIGYKLVYVDTLVINKMQAVNGLIGVSKISGITSPDYSIYKCRQCYYDINYFGHLLNIQHYIDEYKKSVTGVMEGFIRLYTDDLFRIYALVPPLKEQMAIVHFLDRKTNLIDKAIGIKEKQIELLKERRQILIHRAVTRGINPNVKLKDSGVEWIGEVPEHWEVKRLKDVCFINLNSLPEYTNNNFQFRYVDIGSVTLEKGIIQTEEYIFKNAPSRARRIAQNGDTVISTVRTYLKAIDFIDEEKSNFIYSTGFAVLKPKTFIYPEYLSCYVRSDAFTEQVTINSKGMSYPAINSTDLGRLIVVHCAIEEQKTIVNHIETITNKIATAISLKEQEIEKLKEYKAVLINEAVTGKIKVG